MTTAISAPAPAYTPDVSVAPHESSIARRLVERFGLIALALYHIPLFLNNYPSLGGGGFNETGLAPRWGHVFTIPGIWVARHVFHITGPMPSGANGDNGDVSEEYARLLLCVVIGLIGAIAWSIADRKKPGARWVESTMRVMLRYSIALGLMSYAISKLVPQQFPPIGPATLERRVGDLSPMSLLWTFMQYSRPYAFFGGLMELVAVLLLCFRRTATLGALVCVAVMTNVALLNYAYGVPVKLYATMITLSAAVLVLYDTRRLFDFFVRDRAVAESRESTILQDHVPKGWRWGLKAGAVGSVALSSLVAMTLVSPEPAPLEGTWIVSTPNQSWRRMSIDPFGLSIRTAGDSTIRCGRTPDAGAATLAFRCAGGKKGDLKWTRNADTLTLGGTFADSPVSVSAVHVSRESYPLMRSKFRWIFD